LLFAFNSKKEKKQFFIFSKTLHLVNGDALFLGFADDALSRVLESSPMRAIQRKKKDFTLHVLSLRFLLLDLFLHSSSFLCLYYLCIIWSGGAIV